QRASKRDYKVCKSIIFAGTWIKRKGIEDVGQAFSILTERRPELQLTVLGAGVPEGTILADFPEPMRAKIGYVRAKNEQENADAFANADIFLLPSLFERTPLTLIEAMMAGLPIVTTSTCGMKDVIRDRHNGMLVPLRSAVGIVRCIEELMD